MKKLILTLALVISMSVPAFADTTIATWDSVKGTTDYQGTQATSAAAGKSANGIVFSRHNLSSYGEHYQATTSVDGSAVAQTVITTEVCVFCHTPHFGRVDTAPMWNRGTSATGYTAYGASNQTLAGSSTSVGGSSLACLSCHDGVTTLDNLINKPGKGSMTNYTVSNTAVLNGDQGWMFGEIAPFQTVGGNDPSRLNIGGNNAGSRSAANIDLSNDHPIGVIYNAGNVASLRLPGTVINDIAMNNAKANEQGQEYGRSDNLWSVRGFISNTAAITDLLRDGNMVQCASCHDPHYKNQTNTDPSVVASYGEVIDHKDSDGLFLRRVGGNSNSGVCRTCHNK